MKKLILSLLTLASLTACKKDIVEPVVENTVVNRLPKKMIRRFEHSSNTGVDYNVNYYDFHYNNQNLLSFVVSYDSLDINKKDTVLSLTYDDNNRVISKFYNQRTTIDYIYDGDIVTKKCIKGSCCGYDTLYSQNGFFMKKNDDTDGLFQVFSDYAENGTYKDLPIGTKNSNSIFLRSDEMWSGNYTFLTKEIEFQVELAVALGLHVIVPKEDALRMDNKYYYCASKSSSYTGCEIENFEYKIDQFNRLISINNHANNLSTCMKRYISTIIY